MAKIFVENQAHEVDSKKNLLEVCLSLGYDIPYFCWHPALGSVGACRQCAVKQFRDENDKQGKLVMSCMTPADDGSRISIHDEEAREFRESIVEWLMTNHPHDCPVCDEGGECHLQDMTVMTGHTYRDYRFPKRTFENQYLGPFLNHEMNRCIECYRCVRYYREYAGGRDLNVFASRNRVYFGRHEDGVLENEFSGNLVEICPTGVFTDKTLKKHYTRKWDLQMAPSLCVHCAAGCNITPGERYGTVRRIVNRYNHHVNGYFLCDRGRFGYEFVNAPERIREPQMRGHGGTLAPVQKQAALGAVAQMLETPEKVIGIGSPRASIESNYALRELVGEEHFYSGVSETERRLTARAIEILRTGPARTPSLVEIEAADAVLILGEDVTQTAPRLALGLRQAALNAPREKAKKIGIPQWHDAALREVIQAEHGPFFIASAAGSRLDEVATATLRAAPNEVARFGFAVAHALDSASPQPSNLSADMQQLAQKAAEALKQAQRPLIVAGVSCGSMAIVEAAANVAAALCRPEAPAHLAIVLPECNSMGLGLLAPRSLDEAAEAVRSGAAETVIVLENDLFRRMGRAEAEALLQGAKAVVAIDHLLNDTTGRAAIVFPASTFAEGDGTLVSHEGRAQGFVQLAGATGSVQESWRWLREISLAAGHHRMADWLNVTEVRTAIADGLKIFAGLESVTPPGSFRIAGQKIPRAPHRYSGRTAMLANISVHEPKPPEDPDSPLSFSMEGYPGMPPASVNPFFWAPSWNSIQSTAKFQEEVGGELRGGDPGLRLLEPPAAADPQYHSDAPADPAQPNGEWLAVPLHHIFGSEELSILSPAIAERAPKPYVALHPEDAGALNLAEGTEAEVRINGSTQRLPVKLAPDMARGLAGIPAGLPQTKSLQLPAWSRITKLP
ncbi:MAG: NADH-quinone oxidoreductase subunit NuoG [Bryobacterales bacterium]